MLLGRLLSIDQHFGLFRAVALVAGQLLAGVVRGEVAGTDASSAGKDVAQAATDALARGVLQGKHVATALLTVVDHLARVLLELHLLKFKQFLVLLYLSHFIFTILFTEVLVMVL